MNAIREKELAEVSIAEDKTEALRVQLKDLKAEYTEYKRKARVVVGSYDEQLAGMRSDVKTMKEQMDTANADAISVRVTLGYEKARSLDLTNQLTALQTKWDDNQTLTAQLDRERASKLDELQAQHLSNTTRLDTMHGELQSAVEKMKELGAVNTSLEKANATLERIVGEKIKAHTDLTVKHRIDMAALRNQFDISIGCAASPLMESVDPVTTPSSTTTDTTNNNHAHSIVMGANARIVKHLKQGTKRSAEGIEESVEIVDESDEDQDQYCVCTAESRMGRDERTWIKCESKKCSHKWFHIDCVGLDEAPKGRWRCIDCARSRYKKQKL